MIGILVRGGASVSAVQAKLAKRAGGLALKNRLTMERVVMTLKRDVGLHGLSGKAGSNDFWGKTGAAGDELASVTNTARKTLVARTFTRMARAIGVVGSPLAYFAMHEFGGTIRGNQYLRIPTRWMKKPSGQDRLQGRSAKSLPNTIIRKSRAGHLFIFEVGTPRAKASQHGIIPLYMLVTSVRLRARHMLRNSMRRNRAMIHSAFRRVAASVRRG